jgi:hypothetical protein
MAGMITVEVPVDCGGAEHRVVLKVSTGRVRCFLPDHDQNAEDVLEALGGTPSECGLVRRTPPRLRKSVPSAIDRANWVRVGVRDLSGLELWRSAGVRTPGVAERWLSFTVNGLVATWRGCGFESPAQAAPWARAGFSPDDARLWVKLGQTVDQAIEWTAGGISSPEEAAGWSWLGVHSPEQTESWVKAGVPSGSEAETWARLGVTCPDEVRRWHRAGALDAADAVDWVRSGVVIDAAKTQIAAWRQAGATRGRDAIAWTRAGTRSADISKWQEWGVDSASECAAWRALGIEVPEDLVQWRELGIRDGALAQAWVKAGVRRPEDIEAWNSAGVSEPREALAWIYPKFVFNTSEVAAWKSSGVTSPGEARHRLARAAMPARVLEVRLDAVRGVSHPDRDGRPPEVVPARPGACPTAVVTERYFYLFWHSCQPDVATDVVEVDFDAGGNEVSRCTRPLARTEHHPKDGS